MIVTYQAAQTKKKKSGRPPALTLEEQILFTLEFWREYPSMFHHGFEWGIHETTALRTVERVENALIASKLFSLPSNELCVKRSISRWWSLMWLKRRLSAPKKATPVLQR